MIDIIELVLELDRYEHVDDICEPFACIRNHFVKDQTPVWLVLLDAMNRFPRDLDEEGFQWRLALARVVQGNHDSDDWLLAQVELALNQNGVPVKHLNDFVRPYGFQIEPEVPYYLDTDTMLVSDLFGPDRAGELYRLSTQNMSTRGGLFFVLIQDNNAYQLVPVYSDWSFNTGDDFLTESGDYNQNGTTELLIYSGSHSGTTCYGRLLVLEWNGSKFVDLSRGKFYNDFPRCDSIPGFGDLDENGFATLLATDPDTGRVVTYGWNGKFYQPVPGKYTGQPETILPFMIADGEYAHASQLIEQQLATHTITGAFRNYLLFQTGMIAALQSNSGQAQTIFKSLVISSSQTITPAQSRAAQVFLQTYQGDDTVYGACQAALAVMETAVAPYQDQYGIVPDDKMLAIWGTSSTLLCDLQPAFKLLVGTTLTQQAANPIAALQSAGVRILKSIQLDLTNDGTPDWVLFVAQPSQRLGYSQIDVWTLQKISGSWEAYFLDSQDNIENATISTAPFMAALSMPSTYENPLLVIQVGNYIKAFERNPTTDSAWEKLLDVNNVQSFFIRTGSGKVDIETWSTLTSRARPWIVYRWDVQADRIQEVDRLAEMIFMDHNPGAALPILQQVLTDLNSVAEPEDMDRYTYLFGLAYELSGDATHAVQTYLQLWRDYPGSPYALIARTKLKPVP